MATLKETYAAFRRVDERFGQVEATLSQLMPTWADDRVIKEMLAEQDVLMTEQRRLIAISKKSEGQFVCELLELLRHQ